MQARILQAAVVMVGMVGCGQGIEPQSPAERNTEELAPVSSTVSHDVEALKAASKTPSVTVKLNATNAETLSGTPTWMSSFVINNTNEVYFAADLGGVSGHHVMNFFVMMPGGSAYQTISVPFAAGVTPASGEQAAEKISGGYRVWAGMPVAGTIIQQYSLTGPWSADVTLDSASSPAASDSFSMN